MKLTVQSYVVAKEIMLSPAMRQIRKGMLFMKLTGVILLAACLQVSATVYSQEVTLRQKNASLVDILKEIRIQTGYTFLYSNEIISRGKAVSVNFKSTPLKNALDEIFEDQPLQYSFNEQTILIKEKQSGFFSKTKDVVLKLLQEIDVRGRVVDEKREPLIGATIRVLDTERTALTDNQGYFNLLNVNEKAVLVVNYVGYKSQQIPARQSGPLVIKLEPEASNLENVDIVSTGYQTLSKERATGSFEKVNNNLFNRTTGTDVISRLNLTVPGIYGNRSTGVTSRFSDPVNSVNIRGLSSLSVNRPLIILDNIPYEGDIKNINPNDIEDVTLLKDAAAASIWGARAGNGVIVFRTKSGKYNQPLQISINANVSVSNKPDLFYLPQMNSSEFIEVEKYLFSQGRYDDRLNTTIPYAPFVTPVVELLAKQRSLPLNDVEGREQINAEIDAMRKYDVRNDFEKYVYRKPIKQQYALNLLGGSNQVNYYLSAGYDKNLNELVTSGNDRITLKSNIDFRPVKKITVQTGIILTQYNVTDAGTDNPVAYGQGLLSGLYPYASLAGDNGQPLPVGVTYSTGYLTDLKANTSLLDWFYRPLQDMKESYYHQNAKDILFNISANYQIFNGLSAELRYSYQNNNLKSEELYRPGSYYVRDLTNYYTDPSTMQSPVPPGGIFKTGNSDFTTQTYRAQLNYNKIWSQKHEITAIAGAEARKYFTRSNLQKFLYGYNENTRTSINVDTKKEDYIQYFGDIGQLPDEGTINDNSNRFTSLYANASYIYNRKYTISASVRKDASNVFGDNTNKNGKPTWSIGGGWNISNEKFWNLEALPLFKLKVTYGYSGNVNNSVPAYSVVNYNPPFVTNYPFARTINPPNPDLRWEKVGMLNLGLDFALKNNRLAGSIEFYDKRSYDIITVSPIDPTKGFQQQTYNTANIHGNGFDVSVNSQNLNIGNFQWNSNLVFSYNKNIVTKLLLKRTSNVYVNNTNSINPIEGFDLNALFVYPSDGLDPQTGDPRGILNGQISKDYAALIDPNRPVSDLLYIGTSRPRYFGSLRNGFSFKGFELSINILYKLAYHFKRNGISYAALFFANTGHSEFANRWQQPGDEARTTVPSMVYPIDQNRDFFYNTSSAIIEKGDHVRLQDITGSYSFKNIKGIHNLKLYANVSNLGIIWRANKLGLDPDITSGYRTPFTMAFGVNATF